MCISLPVQRPYSVDMRIFGTDAGQTETIAMNKSHVCVCVFVCGLGVRVCGHLFNGLKRYLAFTMWHMTEEINIMDMMSLDASCELCKCISHSKVWSA